MKNRLLAALLILALLTMAAGGAAALAEEAAREDVPAVAQEIPAEEPPDLNEVRESADDDTEPEADEALPDAPQGEAEADEPEEAPEAGETCVCEDDPEEGDPEDAVELLPVSGSAEVPDESEISSNPEGVNPKDCQHPVTVEVVNRDAGNICYVDLHNGTHRICGKGVLVTLCADCGMAVSRRDEYVEKCAYGGTGESALRCQWCGHVRGDDGRHTHDFTGEYYTFTGELLETFPAEDAPELYHICRFQKTQARKCSRCEAFEAAAEVPGETVDQREYHVWNANGQCAVCGYARTCRHDGGEYENVWTEDERYGFVNASVHEYTAVRYAQRCCAGCGEPISNVDVTRVTERQPHRFVDGCCVDCGYVNVCGHPDMSYTYGVDEGAVFAPLDAATHEVLSGAYIAGERCPDCGFAVTGAHLALGTRQRAVLPHRFDENGVCRDCGFSAAAREAECDHPEEYRIALDRGDVDGLKKACRYSVDESLSTESRHVLRVEYDPSWVCGLCGHREDLSGQTEIVTVSEPHLFNRGYCVTGNCGYKCTHSHVEGQRDIGSPFYDYDDGSGHYETTPVLVTGICALCGEYVQNYTSDRLRGRKEAHVMQNGVCRKCGYACPHPPEDVVQLLPAQRTVCVPYSDAEHVTREERVTETICKVCGYTLFETVEILSESLGPHRFEVGTCVECGAVAGGEVAPESAEVFAPLPAGTRLNGVAVEDGLDIVKTSMRVGDSLQPEIDAGRVHVEIEKLSGLLTEDELQIFSALPLREQLLTAQCFLGFRNTVAAAVAGDTSMLSNRARLLINDIQNRIADMSDDARETLENALRSAFPMASYEVAPGATTEVFNIDLAVDADGTVSHVRYSFHNTGSAWMLIGIAER